MQRNRERLRAVTILLPIYIILYYAIRDNNIQRGNYLVKLLEVINNFLITKEGNGAIPPTHKCVGIFAQQS